MSTPTPPLPTPLPIPADLIVAGSSAIIPLHAVPIGGGGYKLGLVVRAQDAQGNQSNDLLFELDTGGQGFWMAPSGQIPTPALEDCTLQISYTSGIEYQAQPVSLTLSFPEANTPLAATAVVGLVGKVSGKYDQFPIFQKLYGDFGASLQAYTQQGQPQLLTVLAQLPAPYNTGFIVDIGPYPPTADQGVQSPPRVIVGLTDALRQQFPNTVPMTAQPPYISGPAAAPIATFAETLIEAQLSVGGQTVPEPVAVVFDTGAAHTMIHKGNVVTPSYKPLVGDQIALVPSANPSFAVLNFTNSSPPSVAGWATKGALNIAAGYINTGLNPFYSSPVMFDLANGLVRFPATVNF